MKKSDKNAGDANSEIPDANQLQRQMLEAQLEEFKKREKLRAEQQKQDSDFANNFLKEHVTEAERVKIRRQVTNAVKDGKYEALVYSFPSSLCTDSGRAINNSDPNWPNTLQGKAKEHYERYQAIARPKGYRLKAMIINFPGGIPGDVGFFLNWEPELD